MLKKQQQRDIGVAAANAAKRRIQQVLAMTSLSIDVAVSKSFKIYHSPPIFFHLIVLLLLLLILLLLLLPPTSTGKSCR